MACPWMNDQASRFVDNQQVLVFEKNVEGDGFGLGLDFFRRRFAQVDPVAGPDAVARPGVLAIQPNESVLDQLLKAGARKLRTLTREKKVQARWNASSRHHQLDGFCCLFG
jgi:hypothetical protein